MKIKSEITKLAKLFPTSAPLYLVGGYVRNNLLGIHTSDIDVCSSLCPEEIKKQLVDSNFVVCDKELRLGTLIITSDNFVGEYTTFRTDSYASDGTHTPNEVSFTKSIEEDSKRRDFTINSVYYNPLTDEILDFVGGMHDIRNHIIRAVYNPDDVFSADGLRILRMVRFACQLGFEIEPKTLEAAKENVWRIKDIAPERIRDELDKIFIADTCYEELGLENAHYRGIKLLDEIGALEILLPEVCLMKGVAQPKKYHLFDAYNHSLEAFRFSDPKVRWAALLHDIGKPISIKIQGDMHNHPTLGSKVAAKIFDRLKFPSKEKERNCKLIENHMVDLDGTMSENKLRRYIVKHQDIIEDLALLKEADYYGTKCQIMEDNRIRRIYKELQSDGTALSIRDLPVNGKDLISMGIEPAKRSKILNLLWMDSINNQNLLNRDVALNYVKKMERQI